MANAIPFLFPHKYFFSLGALSIGLMCALAISLVPSFGHAKETIVDDRTLTVSLPISQLSWGCDGSYEDEYEHEGWELDEYKVKITHAQIPNVVFEGRIRRGQDVDCPRAMELLKEEAQASQSALVRQIRVKTVNVVFNSFDRGPKCVEYTYIQYQLELFKGIEVKEHEYSGELRLGPSKHTPGQCLDPEA